MPAKKAIPGKVKLPYRGDWKLFKHNELGASFVGQVVWNTVSQCVFFFFGHFVFFARPRRFGEKKVTRNIDKKAHGLILVRKKSEMLCFFFSCSYCYVYL